MGVGRLYYLGHLQWDCRKNPIIPAENIWYGLDVTLAGDRAVSLAIITAVFLQEIQ